MNSFLRFKTLWLALFAAAFFAAPNSAHATHALGADLTYTYLGNNSYRFTVAFYRDCNGIAAPNTLIATVNGCGNAAQNFTLTQVGLGTEITPTCATAASTCSGGAVLGVQRYIYEGVFTFASQCPNWKVSVQECCRNAAISTIANATSFEIYVQAVVNNTIVNNAPIFTQTPALYACVNQPFIYNNVVIDTDGDSLSYALTNPLDGPAPGTSISYATGFSALEPLSVDAAGFGFNNVTGQMSFTPTTVGEISVLAFLVKEYRNGVFIGSVMRDVQIIVQNCAANTAPTLGNITNVTGATFAAANGSGRFKICVGQAMSFRISASDIDAGQTVSIITNFLTEFPTAVVTVAQTTANAATLTFAWTPTSDDAGAHLFRVEARDNHCPTYATAVKGFIIEVQGVTGRALNAIICKGSPTAIQLTAQASEVAGGQYQWTASPSLGTLPNTQNITVTIAQTTTFTIRYQDNICNASDTIIVTAYGNIAATPATVNAYCPSDAPIQLAATYTNPAPTTPPTPAITYTWAVTPAASGSVSNSTIANPTATVNAAANGTTIRYIVTANDGRCSLKDTVVVNAACATCFNVASISAPNTTELTCTRNSITLFATALGSNGVLTYIWSNGGRAASIAVTQAAIYTVTITNTLTNGTTCTATASIAITQNTSVPTLTLTKRNDLDCASTSAVLNATAAGTNVTFQWSSNVTTPTITVTAAGTYTVTATNTANGCTASSAITVSQNITPPAVLATAANMLDCARPTALLIATSPILSPIFRWSNGDPVATTTVTAPNTYRVTVVNPANNCSATASIVVTRDTVKPIVGILGNTALDCNRPSVILLAGSNVAPNITYVWSNGAITRNITVTTANVYSVTGTNTINGCTAVRTVSVTADFTAPILTVSGLTSFCSNRSSILIATTGATFSNFVWNNGIRNASNTVTAAGIYTVTATNTTNNCTASTQVSVTTRPAPIPVVTQPLVFCVGIPTGLIASGGSTYRWNTNETTAAVAVPITVTAATYTVTVTAANGCTATTAKVVEFLTGSVCVGTENAAAAADNIALFPNPITEGVNLVFGTNKWLDATIAVTDIAGRTVYMVQKLLILPSETLYIPSNDWATGMYFITISNKNDKKVLKVVK